MMPSSNSIGTGGCFSRIAMTAGDDATGGSAGAGTVAGAEADVVGSAAKASSTDEESSTSEGVGRGDGTSDSALGLMTGGRWIWTGRAGITRGLKPVSLNRGWAGGGGGGRGAGMW